MDRLKAFLVGALKIALALFLVVIALIGAIQGWNVYDESRRKSHDAPLAQPKAWPSKSVEPLSGVQLSLVTIWRDGQLHYQFFADRYPKAVERARDARRDGSSRDSKFTMSFLDANGFMVLSHDVPLNSMAKILDAKGQGTGLQANSSALMTADQYRNAARWDITWNFPSEAEVAAPTPAPTPKPTPQPEIARPKPKVDVPKWRNLSLWRQLNRQMSKAQVEQLLGQPTRVSEGGALSFWYYGYPIGGHVAFDRNGAIHSWQEP